MVYIKVFPDEIFPNHVKDTIVIAKALRLRLVWIDALCILQDDPDDLKREISKTGSIHQNNVLNVGALEPFAGLFRRRDPRKFSPFHVDIERENFKGKGFACYCNIAHDMNRYPLLNRGWVLQERLFSPRSLYFGSQMFWECGEICACEVFPDYIGELTKGTSIPFRLSSMFASHHDQCGRPIHEYSDGRQKKMTYDFWKTTVEDYTTCELPFKQVLLPALSGLAHRFRSALKDEYFAGLWGKDILHDILWRCDDSSDARVRVYPAKYPGDVQVLSHFLSG
ncbi:hypothetical protein ACN47E_001459 [Coniothyrium glycines]